MASRVLMITALVALASPSFAQELPRISDNITQDLNLENLLVDPNGTLSAQHPSHTPSQSADQLRPIEQFQFLPDPDINTLDPSKIVPANQDRGVRDPFSEETGTSEPDVSEQVLRGNQVSVDTLRSLLSVNPTLNDRVHTNLTVDSTHLEKLLSNDQNKAWDDILQGNPAVIDLGPLVGEEGIPAEILSRGLEAYAIYDRNGKFIKLVFVPWNAEVEEFIESAANHLQEGWTYVSTLFSSGGELVISIGKKIQNALDRVKQWACDIEPRPIEVSVAVEGQFNLLVTSFSGAVGATYRSDDLCRDG